MMAYRYGGFWRRGLAILFDKLMLYCLYTALVILEFAVLPSHPYAHYPNGPSGWTEFITGPFLFGHLVVFVVMAAVYFTYFHASLGQTPGKVLLDIKVVRTTGKSLTWGIALLRWACYMISAVFFYLGFIWAAFDGRKQAWHDKIVGTMVVVVNGNDRRNGPQQLSINI